MNKNLVEQNPKGGHRGMQCTKSIKILVTLILALLTLAVVMAGYASASPDELEVDCDSTTDWFFGAGLIGIDTTDKQEGTASITATNTGGSGPTFANYDPAGTWDFSGEDRVVFWFKTQDATGLYDVVFSESDGDKVIYSFAAGATWKQEVVDISDHKTAADIVGGDGTFDWTDVDFLSFGDYDRQTKIWVDHILIPGEGEITIIKLTNPTDYNQDFQFEASPAPVSDFTLNPSTTPSTQFTGLISGTYAFTEVVPTGWDLMALVCTYDYGDVTLDFPSRTITIDLFWGGDFTCSFQNEKLVTVRARKYEDLNMNGVRDAGEPYLSGWSVTLSDESGEIDTKQTDGSGLAVWSNLEPRYIYTVCETLKDGWVNSEPGGGELCYRSSFDPGEVSTFLFGNYELGHITIIKETDPPGYDQDFQFEKTSVPAEYFTLNAAVTPTQVCNDLQINKTWTIRELGPPAGWVLSDTVCVSNQTGAFRPDPLNPVDIYLTSGEWVTCTFTNMKLATITATKYEDLDADGARDAGEPGLDGWDMELSDAGGVLATGVTHSGGQVTFSDLDPYKTYTVCETLQPDWFNSQPGGGELCQSVYLTPGQAHTVEFGNYQQGEITIEKHTDPADEDYDFSFSGDLGDFSLNDFSDGSVTFEDLDPGTYDVAETLDFGWDLTGIVCQDASGGTSIDVPNGQASIDIQSAEHVTCTFTNDALESDGDGVFDYLECPGGPPCDRDGDGIANHLDYDPTGYIYELWSGRIITGGLVSVTGPHAGAVTLLHDGSEGFYQFATDGTPGTYVISLTLPTGYVLPYYCPAQEVPLDPTGQPSPVVLGAGEVGDSGYLDSGECFDNIYYWAFELEPRDPIIINNNFPLHVIVGGETRPPDRLALLAPALSLVALGGVVLSGALAWRRRPDAL
jgi:hypothetical protein